ncbi:MAG: bifunctional folylpolyglutamate synthase/dihydrofolate synthase [Oscillospiraceae bacterium]|nr:bifunctional folylpolyglutamate synthase/dihydrofolate synthase [Oscillospiraceae bacterium]
MNYNEALEYIHSRPRMKNTDNRRAMRLLLEQLGNPQDKLSIVHIAGTNGKGSCAKMLSNILSVAGYKTGLNISPFVIDFRERFTINGEFISEETLVQITEKVKAKQEYIWERYQLKLVEFEIVTAIAFCYFAQEKCDIICLEVGIGGREDSTNVIKESLLSCIMNISFDHTDMLGETIAEIAYQKAGIIKSNGTVIAYPAMEKDAMDVIKAEAEKQNAKLIVPDMSALNTAHKGYFEDTLVYKDISVTQSFAGVHQSYNTSVVIEAAKVLNDSGKYKITAEDIKKGIEQTTFPARIEVFSKEPLIILDGAHNLDGVTALKNVLETNGVKNLTAVWASLSDKQPEKLIETMAPYIDKLYTVDIFGSRAIPKAELADMSKKYIPDCTAAESLESAIETAISKGENFIVFGSLYLASDARKIIIEKL